MKRGSFAAGALILASSAFVVKLFGFAYRLYLSNLIGAEGMGLFQLISPIYSLIILTLTSGVSIAVSKMVAEQYAKNDFLSARRITKYAFIILFVSGILVSCCLWFSSDYLANSVLKDDRTYLSLIALVPCIPVIIVAAVFKGYFYATNNVMPTAISQILEQGVKMGLILILSERFLNMGLNYACMLGTLAAAIGEIVNLVILILVYKFIRTTKLSQKQKTTLDRKEIVFKLMGIIIPVSFNRFVTSILAAIEFILIPRMLLKYGMDYKVSMCEYGKLTGMAMPLIFFPCLITSAIAITLVPAIAQGMSVNNFKLVNHRISKSIQVTSFLGFACTAMFFAFPEVIGNILYKAESISETLKLLSFTCLFTYLQQTLIGILNGLDKQAISLRNSLVGCVMRILFVYFSVPIYGLKGYIYGICASLGVVCILNIYVIIKNTGISVDVRNWILKPAFALIVIPIAKYLL